MVSSTAMRSRPAANPLTIRSKLALASVMSVPSAFTTKSPCMLLKSDHGQPHGFPGQVLREQGDEIPPARVIVPDPVVHLRFQEHRAHDAHDAVRALGVVLRGNELVEDERQQKRLAAETPGVEHNLKYHPQRVEPLELPQVPERANATMDALDTLGVLSLPRCIFSRRRRFSSASTSAAAGFLYAASTAV